MAKKDLINDVWSEDLSTPKKQDLVEKVWTQGTPTPTQQPTTKKRTATLADQFKVGVEEGVTPFLPSLALKGGYGAYDTKGGALSRTAGAVKNAFDPNSTAYAKLASVEFPENPGWTGIAANFLGNVAGSVGKLGVGALAGGVGAIPAAGDVAAQMGAKYGGKALLKSLPKLAAYEASKQGIGMLGGMAGGKSVASALSSSDWFNKLSPQDQSDVMTLATTGAGLGTGITVGKLASKGAQSNQVLRTLRDNAVEGSAIPTYKEVEKAKATQEQTNKPAVQEVLSTKEPEMQQPQPAKKVQEQLQQEVVAPSEVAQKAAEVLRNVNAFHGDAKKISMQAKESITKPIANKTLQPNDPFANDALASIKNSIGAEVNSPENQVYYSGKTMLPKTEETTSVVNLGSGGKIGLSDKGIDIQHPQDMNQAISSGAAINDLHSIIGAHNELLNAQGAKNKEAAVPALQSYLDEIGSVGKTPEENTGILKSSLQNLGLDDSVINNLVKDGKADAKGVIEAYNKANIPTPKDASLTAREIALEQLTHDSPKGLTEKDAETFADVLTGRNATNAIAKNIENNTRMIGQSSSITGAKKFEEAMHEFVSPNNPDAAPQLLDNTYHQISTALGAKPNAVSDMFKTATSEDADLSSRINAWENINTLFGNMGKLLKSDSPAGFAHSGMAGIVKHSLSKVPKTLEELHFADIVKQLTEAGLPPQGKELNAVLREAKKRAKESLSRDQLMIDGNQVELTTAGGVVSLPLTQATERLFQANKTHPLSAVEGRDIAPASWLKKLDTSLRGATLESLDMNTIENFLTAINKSIPLHSNSSPHVEKVKRDLKGLRARLIEQEYGSEAPRLIEAMNWLDAAQAENIVSTKAHNLTNPQLARGQRKMGVNLEGTEEFAPTQTADYLAKANEALGGGNLDISGLQQKGLNVQQQLGQLAKSSGKYNEFLKTQQNLYENKGEFGGKKVENIGNKPKLENYADVYAMVNPSPTGKTSVPREGGVAPDVLTGKQSPDKLKKLQEEAVLLRDEGVFSSKEAQQKANKIFLDDMVDGVQHEIEKVSKEVFETNKSGKLPSGVSGYSPANFDKVIKTINNISDNFTKIAENSEYNDLRELIKTRPELAMYDKESPFMKAINDKTFEGMVDQLGKAKNTQEVLNLADRADKLEKNFIKAYANDYGELPSKSLEQMDFKDQRKLGLLSKILGATLFHHGVGRRLLHLEHATHANRIGTTKNEARAEVYRDLTTLLSNPYRKDPETGKTYLDIVKDNIKQAEKTLKQTNTIKNNLRIGKPMMTYGNPAFMSGKVGYQPMSGIGMSYAEDNE